MYLQDVNSVYDIKWNKDLTYGDIFKKAEYEHSAYSFDFADIDMLKGLFTTFEKESERVIEKGLVLPAYDYVLKCSHVFNVLDARGAISVSERTSYISRVRNLAKAVAVAYLKEREEMGYPLMNKVGADNE